MKAADGPGNVWLTCVGSGGSRVRAGGGGRGHISPLSSLLRRARRKRRSTCPQGGNSQSGGPGLEGARAARAPPPVVSHRRPNVGSAAAHIASALSAQVGRLIRHSSESPSRGRLISGDWAGHANHRERPHAKTSRGTAAHLKFLCSTRRATNANGRSR